jgi:branched-chain amino acid transport system substrate-binding protein
VVGLLAGDGACLDASVLNLHSIAGLPVIAPLLTTSAGMEAGAGPIRLALDGAQLAGALVDEMTRRGIRRPTVLEPEDGTSDGELAAAVARLAAERGWACDNQPAAAPDVLVAKLRAHRSDALVVGEDLELALGLGEALRQAGLAIPVLGGPGLHQPERLRKAGAKAEGLVAVTMMDGGTLAAEDHTFSRLYREAFREEPGAEAALAYDGVSLLVRALDLAGPRREGVSSAVQKLARQGYEGVAGRFTHAASGEVHRTVTVAQVKAGRLVPLRQVAL